MVKRIKRIKRRRKVEPKEGLKVIEGGKGQPDTVEPEAVDEKPLSRSERGDIRLTNKQRAFVKAMLKPGTTQSDAYRAAYDAENMSAKAICTEAWGLMQHPVIARAVSTGLAAQEQHAVQSGATLRVKLEEFLMGVVNDEGEKSSDRLRAAELVGKSEKVGYFLERSATVEEELTPEQVEQELNEKLKSAFKSTG